MIKISLLGKIKSRKHLARGISTAGNILHMKSVNNLIHKNNRKTEHKKNTALSMNADVHVKV